MATDLETPAAEAATAVSAGRRVVYLDEENPWPSLDSFTENAALFFKGRNDENQELQRRITRHTHCAFRHLRVGQDFASPGRSISHIKGRGLHASAHSARSQFEPAAQLGGAGASGTAQRTGTRALPCAPRTRNERKPMGLFSSTRARDPRSRNGRPGCQRRPSLRSIRGNF